MNRTISADIDRHYTLDSNYFYLNSILDEHEHAWKDLALSLNEFIKLHDVTNIAKKVKVLAEVRKIMHSIKKDGNFEYEDLI